MIKETVKLINLTEYYDQLLAIWCTCFPEDADFGETFLKEAAPLTKIFGVCEDNVLVSCAYCLPATFCDGEQRFTAYYIYGVGTLPTHRGKGYAKDVLAYIKQAASCDVLFLYPAKPSLRAFYQQLGYRSVLYRTACTIPPSDAIPPKVVKTPFAAKAYTRKRTAFLSGKDVAYAVFDDAILQTLLSHAQVVSFDGGWALCITDDETVYFPEILCDELPARSLAAEKTIVYMAGTEQESGMLLPCSMRAEAYFQTRKKIPFFGTFFAE